MDFVSSSLKDEVVVAPTEKQNALEHIVSLYGLAVILHDFIGVKWDEVFEAINLKQLMMSNDRVRDLTSLAFRLQNMFNSKVSMSSMQQSFATKVNNVCFALASWIANNNDNEQSKWMCLHFAVLMSVSSSVTKSLLVPAYNTVAAIEAMNTPNLVVFGNTMPQTTGTEGLGHSDTSIDLLSYTDNIFGPEEDQLGAVDSFGESDFFDSLSFDTDTDPPLPAFSVDLQAGDMPVIQPLAQQTTPQSVPPPPPPPPTTATTTTNQQTRVPSIWTPHPSGRGTTVVSTRNNNDNNHLSLNLSLSNNNKRRRTNYDNPRYKNQTRKIPKNLQQFSAIGACIYISQRIIGVKSYQDYSNHGGFSKIIKKMVDIVHTDPVFAHLRKSRKQNQKNFERDLPMVIPGSPSKHHRTYIDEDGADGMPTFLRMFDELYKKKGGKMTWLSEGYVTDEELI